MSTQAEKSKARRQRYKAEHRCMQCGAGLQEGDNVLCVECFDKRTEAQERHDAKNPRRNRRRIAKPSKEVAERAERKRRQRYADKVRAGVCVGPGCTNKPIPGERCCRSCRHKSRAHSLASFRRKTWPRILAIQLWQAAAEAHKQTETPVYELRFRVARKVYLHEIKKAA